MGDVVSRRNHVDPSHFNPPVLSIALKRRRVALKTVGIPKQKRK
jgi:hypothetical protein